MYGYYYGNVVDSSKGKTDTVYSIKYVPKTQMVYIDRKPDSTSIPVNMTIPIDTVTVHDEKHSIWSLLGIALAGLIGGLAIMQIIKIFI